MLSAAMQADNMRSFAYDLAMLNMRSVCLGKPNIVPIWKDISRLSVCGVLCNRNILPNVLLRLQAKQHQQELFKAYHNQSNRISKEAKTAYTPSNTKIVIEFIQNRLDSCQAHLQDISCYLEELR